MRLKILLPGRGLWAALPPLAVLAVFFVAPMLAMLHQSLWAPNFSMDSYVAAFTQPVYLRALGNSLKLAVYVTIYCLVLGSFLVYAMDRWGSRWRAAISLALLIPLVTSGELVRVLAWMTAFSPSGPISQVFQFFGFIDTVDGLFPSAGAVIVGLVHILLPFFVFIVYATTRGMDRSIERASLLMGANKLQTFLTVVLPSALPGLLAGTLIVFMMSLGYYATPSLLGTPQDTVLPVLITDQVKKLGEYGQAAALGMLLLVVVLIMMAVLNRLGVMQNLYGGGLDVHATRTKRRRGAAAWQGLVTSKASSSITEALSGNRLIVQGGTFGAKIVVVTLISFLIMPLVVSLGASLTTTDFLTFPPRGLSFEWYEEFIGTSEWTSSTLNSVIVAIITGFIAVVLGACAAAALTRGTFKGKGVFFALLIAPLVVPWIVPALGLYFQSVDMGLAFTYAGLIVGHTVFALPYSTMVISTALGRFDWRLDRAAVMSGANLFERIRDVYIPLLRPAVLSAFLFSFLMSFTEFVFAFFMTNSTLKTLPVKMWEGLTFNISPIVAAAGGIITIAALLALLINGVAQWATQQKQLRTQVKPDVPRQAERQPDLTHV